jgi:hypothetical protein
METATDNPGTIPAVVRTIGENHKRIFHASVRRFKPLHQPVPSILRYKTKKAGKDNFFVRRGV